MLGAEHPVGRDQRECSAPGSLTEDQRYRGGIEVGEVSEAAGDLAGDAALFGVLRQGRARGVDDRHERQVQLCGQTHSTAGLTQRGRSQRGPGILPEPVLSEHDARGGAELRQRQQQSRVLLAFAGAVERQHGVRGGTQQVADTGAFGTAGTRDRRPGVGVRVDRRRCGVRVGHTGRDLLGSHEHVEDSGDRAGDAFGTDDCVDDAHLVEVLTRLHVVRELLPVDGFEHAGAEEADE